MYKGQRRLEVVGDVLIELLVLLFGDFRLGAGPQGARLVDGERLEELPSSRLGNGANVLDYFLTRHADAIVRYGNRAGIAVKADANFKVRVVFKERVIG